MAIKDLKELAKNEKSNLFSIIEEDRIHHDLMEDLIIFEEQNKDPLPVGFKSESYKMFKEINNLQSFRRKKRSRYSNEYLSELKTILSSYPESQQTIRRCLKIPIGTWYRLKKEMKMIDYGSKFSKRRQNNKYSFNDKEKNFIKKLVKPPTFPLTLNRI